MRKELIATLSMLGSLAASGAAAAQTCATPPSCETLGFTKSETDCEGLEALKCPFDQSKLYCPQGGGDDTSAAVPGAIVYSDGTISDSVIVSKTPIGVVAYVSGSIRVAVALTESNQTWGDGFVSCLGEMNEGAASADIKGRINTQCLVSDSKTYPAAEYCHTYSAVLDGTGSSGWYLPAAGELKALADNYNTINYSLQKLSKPQLRPREYWSSSMGYSPSLATKYGGWTFDPYSNEFLNLRPTWSSELVRCFLAF